MFGVIAPDALDLLMRFQSKLAPFVKAPGITDHPNDGQSSIDFNTYRSFRNAQKTDHYRTPSGQNCTRPILTCPNADKKLSTISNKTISRKVERRA